MESARSDFNDRVVAEFGATGRAAAFGDLIGVVHTVGARSGERRENPVGVIARPDGSWLLAASHGGRPTNPGWYYNMRERPGEVTLETAETRDGTGLAVRPIFLEGAERAAAFEEMVRVAPGLAAYESQTERIIPVIRLVP